LAPKRGGIYHDLGVSTPASVRAEEKGNARQSKKPHRTYHSSRRVEWRFASSNSESSSNRKIKRRPKSRGRWQHFPIVPKTTGLSLRWLIVRGLVSRTIANYPLGLISLFGRQLWILAGLRVVKFLKISKN
jgi:hypothetical protein